MSAGKTRLIALSVPFLVFAATWAFPLLATQDSETADPKNLRLWYKKPAEQWTEALPVGNGRLGGMVFGGVPKEHIQFNEDSLWTGLPHD